ncbi:MAG: PQQ-binding-like beta-propeller repeat protein [Myxococcales bacterium]|nr:PQQ-binding-like beta-propeller repeat protein [Myxococcales bacterium]
MIRFRIGQSWKRERSAVPVDAFGLYLHGIDLLAGASEEPLSRVVPDLVDAVHALACEGRAWSQVSLEAHLELCLWRRGAEASLSVVSLGRPPKLLRPPLSVELGELSEAAARCGRALVADLAEASPATLRTQRHRAMVRRLSALERGGLAEPRPRRLGGGFGHRQFPTEPGSFGLEIEDPEDWILAFDPRSPGGLPSLLFGGALTLRASPGGDWRSEGLPFLSALELSRQAAELLHAIESEEERFSFRPGGEGAEVEVRIREGSVRVGAVEAPLEPERLARGMLELGEAVAFALAARNKSQRRNPYVAELIERCHEGLALVRKVRPPEQAGAATGPKRRKGATRPLRVGARLRKLRFEPLWEKSELGGDTTGRLLLSRQGPIFSSGEVACGFALNGELRFRRVAAHGVAASEDGRVLAATLTRILAFTAEDAGARWLKDHDGLPIGPELHRRDGLLIATSKDRGLLAFCEVTGREIWRIDPPRAQRAYLSFQGHRALLATDSGSLYGLEVRDGSVRFRMRAAMPFAAPTVSWGKRLLALLSRGEKSAVFAADAHSGALAWTKELALTAPTAPIAAGSRVLLAGQQDGQSVLVCLSSKGHPLWERRLHLGPGLSLLAVGRSALAHDRSGAAALVTSDGRIDWRVGAAGEEIPRSIPAVLARGVLVLPGESVRAVDPSGGRVLAEVRAGPELCDLKVDGRLNLFLLDEDGGLGAYRLCSHLAVV